MNIEWLKNKAKEKFYPITHAKAVLFGENNKTVNDEIEQIKNDLYKTDKSDATDLNDCIPNGLFGVYTLYYNESHANKPVNFKAGTLFVINSGIFVVQQLFDYENTSNWCRKYYSHSGNWTDWASMQLLN